jgi:hypothetical protein
MRHDQHPEPFALVIHGAVCKHVHGAITSSSTGKSYRSAFSFIALKSLRQNKRWPSESKRTNQTWSLIRTRMPRNVIGMDDGPHTAVSDTGLFKSGGMFTSESCSFKFDKLGSYHFTCSIHPRMVDQTTE